MQRDAALKDGYLGVPRDVFVGHEAGAGAVAGDEHVITYLNFGARHVRASCFKRENAVSKTYPQPFAHIRGGEVGGWSQKPAKGHMGGIACKQAPA